MRRVSLSIITYEFDLTEQTSIVIRARAANDCPIWGRVYCYEMRITGMHEWTPIEREAVVRLFQAKGITLRNIITRTRCALPKDIY